jgi:hypothetical protein
LKDTKRAASNAAPAQAALAVWYGPMPESNGKTNWTAILHKGDIASGMTIARSEYPDRVRYEADHVRWLIGELAVEPWILDYDADKHSGYTAPQPAKEQALDDNSRGILSDALAMYARKHNMAASQRQAIEFALDRLIAAQPAQTD